MAVIIKRLLCLDLPTAGLVIGYLGVFGGIWELIEILLSIFYFDEYYDEQLKEQPSGVELKPIIQAVLFLIFVICLLDLLTSVLLIRGTNKNSHRMLLPWLIIKGIALTILIPITSVCILAGIYAIFNNQGSIILIHSILLAIIACIYSYLYMVIFSLYHFIRDELQKPKNIDSEALYASSNVQYSKT